MLHLIYLMLKHRVQCPGTVDKLGGYTTAGNVGGTLWPHDQFGDKFDSGRGVGWVERVGLVG